MMKLGQKFNRLFTAFTAIILMAGLFSAVSASAIQLPEQTFPQDAQAAINVISPAPAEITVAPGSCLITSGDATRIDYLLNANCSDLTLGILPSWPNLTVIQAVSPEVVATTLPAAPIVRYGHNGFTLIVPQLAVLPTSLYINLFAGLIATSFMAFGLLLISRSRQVKTLFELQVQRC